MKPLLRFRYYRHKNDNLDIQQKIRIIIPSIIIKLNIDFTVLSPEMKQLYKMKEKNYKCEVKSKFLGSLVQSSPLSAVISTNELLLNDAIKNLKMGGHCFTGIPKTPCYH